MPSDPERLAFEFLPSVSRAITRQGVVFNRIRYYEPFLEPLFDTGDRRLVVRFDPRDLSRIYVATAQGVQVVRYRNLARPPMSLWELQAASRQLPGLCRGPDRHRTLASRQWRRVRPRVRSAPHQRKRDALARPV